MVLNSEETGRDDEMAKEIHGLTTPISFRHHVGFCLIQRGANKGTDSRTWNAMQIALEAEYNEALKSGGEIHKGELSPG